MAWVGLEPTIPAPERAKTVHALDRSATVTGRKASYIVLIHSCVLIHFCYVNHVLIASEARTTSSKTGIPIRMEEVSLYFLLCHTD
jgi:hypothetical protein